MSELALRAARVGRWMDPARLTRLAWPVYFELMAVTVAGIIDVAWVASLGAPALGAVTVAITLENLLLGVVLVVGGGTTVLLSQAFGANDKGSIGGILRASAWLSVAVTVVVCGSIWLARHQIAALLVGKGSAETLALTETFLAIAIPGWTVFFAQHVIDGVFKGAGDTRTPMRMAVLANGVLLVLDPLLIFGLAGLPKMGVAGAATATVLSRVIALVVTIILLRRTSWWRERVAAASRTARELASSVWQLLRNGVPMAVDFFARMFATLLIVGVVARFGEYPLAAYGAIIRIVLVFTMAAYALRQGATILAARATGAGDQDSEAAARRATVRMGLALSVLGGIAVLFGSGSVVTALSDEPTGAAAAQIAPWMAAYIALLIVAVVLSGYFFGSGHGGPVAIVTVVGVGLQIVLALALSATPLALTGVWLAMCANTALQCVVLVGYLARGFREPAVATAG